MNETVFQRVCQMNEKFGNPKGDPHRIDMSRLLRQCMNIGQEYIELMNAFGVVVTIQGSQQTVPIRPPEDILHDIRDALCDIKVFADGAHHFMGYDADLDMHAVIDALYSRFCTTPEHFQETKNYYLAKGIETYSEGEYPFVCLKSATDQGDGEYPKGKFLKALGYHKPVFYLIPRPFVAAPVAPPVMTRKFIGMQDRVAPSVTDQMAVERKVRMDIDDKLSARIDAQVKEYRDLLEKHALGLPPYDPNANQCGEKFPAV